MLQQPTPYAVLLAAADTVAQRTAELMGEH
jgi:hypothetical protein